MQKAWGELRLFFDAKHIDLGPIPFCYFLQNIYIVHKRQKIWLNGYI